MKTLSYATFPVITCSPEDTENFGKTVPRRSRRDDGRRDARCGWLRDKAHVPSSGVSSRSTPPTRPRRCTRVFSFGPFTRAHATLPSAPEVNRVGPLLLSHPRLGRVHTFLSPRSPADGEIGEHATRGSGTRDSIHDREARLANALFSAHGFSRGSGLRSVIGLASSSSWTSGSRLSALLVGAEARAGSLIGI